MTDDLKKSLIETRTELESDIVKMNNAISAINVLLGMDTPSRKAGMASGIERRTGGMKQVVTALKSLGSGSINEVAQKVQELFPVLNEQAIYSKTATYLKRLECDGQATFTRKGDGYRTKIYTLTATNNNKLS